MLTYQLFCIHNTG